MPHANPSPMTLPTLGAALCRGAASRILGASTETKSLSQGSKRRSAMKWLLNHLLYQEKTYPGDLCLITCTLKDISKYINKFCYALLAKGPTTRRIFYKLVSTKKENREICSGCYFTVKQFFKLDFFFLLKYMHVYTCVCMCLRVFWFKSNRIGIGF